MEKDSLEKKPDFDDFSLGSEPPTLNQKSPSDVSQNPKNADFSRGSEPPTLNGLHPQPLKISGHSLLWTWQISKEITDRPQRGDFKRVQMRNWEKRIWHLQGGKVVANLQTLEVWIKAAPHRKGVKINLYEAWDRADNLARYFAKWQRIAIAPRHSTHPADLQRAHLVFENPELKTQLNAQAFKPSSAKIGLIFDESHGNKPELTGELAAEGAIGADWVFTCLPSEFAEMKQAIGLLEGENRATAQAVAKIALHLARK